MPLLITLRSYMICNNKNLEGGQKVISPFRGITEKLYKILLKAREFENNCIRYLNIH